MNSHLFLFFENPTRQQTVIFKNPLNFVSILISILLPLQVLVILDSRSSPKYVLPLRLISWWQRGQLFLLKKAWKRKRSIRFLPTKMNSKVNLESMLQPMTSEWICVLDPILVVKIEPKFGQEKCVFTYKIPIVFHLRKPWNNNCQN